MLAYAEVNSSGFTSEVPSARLGLGSSFDSIPRSCASVTTTFGSTPSRSTSISWLATVFSDFASATRKRTGPRYSSFSAFFGFQGCMPAEA